MKKSFLPPHNNINLLLNVEKPKHNSVGFGQRNNETKKKQAKKKKKKIIKKKLKNIIKQNPVLSFPVAIVFL